MAALTYFLTKNTGVLADYDSAADVLYVTTDPAVSSVGEDAPRGLVMRYAMSDDRPTGVTVVGLKHNKWLRNLDALAIIIARHMKVADSEVLRALTDALDNH